MGCSKTPEAFTTEAAANSSEPPENVEARVKVRSEGQVVVKISPLPHAPKDVAVSAAEVRVVLHNNVANEHLQTEQHGSSPKVAGKPQSENVAEAMLLSKEPAATWSALRRW